MSPHKVRFIAFLLTNFRNFSKFGVLCPAFFFRKIPQNFQKFPEIFSTFSKSKKTIVLVTKLVQNGYIDQHSVKFSHKTPKNVQFLLKTLNFSKFSAPSAPKIWSFMSQKSRFFGVRVPSLGQGSAKNTSAQNFSRRLRRRKKPLLSSFAPLEG